MADMTKREKIDKALLAEELGPAEDPEHMLTLYDLIPEEWIGGNETRIDVAGRIAAQLSYAILTELREPDDRMLKAACKSMSPGRRPTQEWVTVKDKHRIRWQAMLDAVGDE